MKKKLPDQATKMAAAADAHFDALEGNGGTQGKDPAPAAQPPATQQAQPAAATPQTATQQPAAAPTAPAPAAQAIQTPPAPAAQPGNPDAASRLATLEAENKRLTDRVGVVVGKYNSETAALRERIIQLETENSTLKSAPAQHQVVTDTDIEKAMQVIKDFDPDVADALDKVLNSRIGSVASRVDNIQNTQTTTARQTMYANLDSRVPNWKELNSNPDFNFWLDSEVVPFSAGKTFRGLITERFGINDGHGVADIFLEYQKANQPAITDPPNPNPGDQSFEPPANGGGGGQRQTPTAPKMIRQEMIDAFYEDKRRGKYTLEQSEKIEADIFKAINGEDGWVVV